MHLLIVSYLLCQCPAERWFPQMLQLSFFLLVLSIKSLREISIIVNTRKTNDHQLFLLDNKSNVSTFKYILQSPPLLLPKTRSTVAGLWPLILLCMCSTRYPSYPVTVSIIHELLHTFRHSSQSHSSSIKCPLITIDIGSY